MPWHTITFQPLVCDLLHRSLINKRIHHGYLLIGEESETKSIALAFAQALNCEKENGDFCGHCNSCIQIAHGQHPDISAIRPESKSRRIVIAQIRELEHLVYLKASYARIKVAILHSTDRLQPEAQDAFLKTLEEPPPKTVFLLLTEEPQQLKETILSRCLRIPFRPTQRKQKTEREKLLETWLAVFTSSTSFSKSAVFRAYSFTGKVLGLLQEVREEKLKETKQLLEDPALDHLESSQRKRLEEQWEAQAQADYLNERSGILKVMLEWYYTHSKVPQPIEILEKLSAQLTHNVNESLAWEIAMLKLAELNTL